MGEAWKRDSTLAGSLGQGALPHLLQLPYGMAEDELGANPENMTVVAVPRFVVWM